MHENESDFDDEEQAMMESIRQLHGFETIDQAFEWLVKSSIREAAKTITGQPRALHAIERKPIA